jgi:hypothetical protein
VNDPKGERLSLLRARLPAGVRRRVVILLEGDAAAYSPNDWRDALVVLERGEVRVECLDGRRITFRQGGVFCLNGIDAQLLRNVGSGTAVLVAVSRRPNTLRTSRHKRPSRGFAR